MLHGAMCDGRVSRRGAIGACGVRSGAWWQPNVSKVHRVPVEDRTALSGLELDASASAVALKAPKSIASNTYSAPSPVNSSDIA